jgi:signal transduction histidine kinase
MISKGKIMEIDRYMKSYSGLPAHKSRIQAQGASMTEIEKIEMQQETMSYIGKEIHDNIGQKLTLASLYAQQLEHENETPEEKDKIDNISFLINQSLSDMRELSKSLTDNSIENNMIYKLIEDECERVRKLNLFTIKFICHSKTITLDYQFKAVIIRIIQEFIQNSIKHAACKNITLQLDVSKKNITLMLLDDGKGFDLSTNYAHGIGLKNMKERTDILNGALKIESKINVGTKITVTIPLK